MTEEISKRDARQGRSKMNVFYVLIGGLALSAACLFILEAVWS